MEVNRLNPVQKATYFVKNQKREKMYLQLMAHVRNIGRKMKVQTEENFQKTIMDEIVNLKKALEQK